MPCPLPVIETWHTFSGLSVTPLHQYLSLFATGEGLAVTPSMRPSAAALRISFKFALSRKTFIATSSLFLSTLGATRLSFYSLASQSNTISMRLR